MEQLNLEESRIMGRRHLSADDKKALVRDIKAAYSNGKLDIRQKGRNDDFLSEFKLTYGQIPFIIDRSVTPETVTGVVKDNRHPLPADALNDDLYICEVAFPRKKGAPVWVYMKFQYLKNGGIRCESFHGNDERIFIDYRYAQDYEDNSFNKLVAKRWMKRYNQYDTNFDKIEAFDVKGDELTFLFATELNTLSDEELKVTMNGLLRSIPPDMGLDGYKMRIPSGRTMMDGYVVFKVVSKPYNK